jgi:hypothetical protein
MIERVSGAFFSIFRGFGRPLGLAVVLVGAGCGESRAGGQGSEGSDGNLSDAGGSPSPAANGAGGPALALAGNSATAPAGIDDGAACVATDSVATLEPVNLAFAFDVSGSMGDDDPDYGDDHERALKWDPVVSATGSFFADPSSSGIHASLTFFPIDAEKDARCAPESYEKPDVALAELPSPAFAVALGGVQPDRGGTPTLAVVSGVIASTQSLLEQHPNAKHALVLVSDGEPQSCKDNAISSIEAAVAKVKDTLPTYVIGVANPSGDDNVKALDGIAKAGGTEHAFIVATGDPAATKTAFAKAVDSIRQTSVSCSVPLPAPPDGAEVDAGKVNVSYTAGQKTQLIYDPDCTRADGWRYDDATHPTSVELCTLTCESVQQSKSATLSVAFGCATFTKPPR